MKTLCIALAAMATFGATAATTTVNNTIGHNILQEKQYNKIEVSKVSKEALDKIKKGYGNYTIKEAYVAADGEYKLILTKDGTDLTATFTPAGDLIKIL
jgi:predicted lipoprotein with Yx(FWY)xxD motif